MEKERERDTPLSTTPGTLTTSSAEGKYDITVDITDHEPRGTLLHIDDVLVLNFDISSGHLPINLQNVIISFLAEKVWLKSLSKRMECRKEKLS